MANTYLTSDLIASEAVALLQSINSLIRLGNRRYEGMLVAKQYAPGNTISLRLDNFYQVQRGDAVTATPITEADVPLTMQDLFSVAIAYDPTDLQRKIVDFSKEFIVPAVRAISTQINAAIYQAALTQVANYTGDISAPLNSIKSVASVNPLMDTLNMNNYSRNLVVDPYNYYQLVTNSDTRNSFLPSLNKALTIDARLGRLVDLEVFKDTGVSKFVSGTHTPATLGGDITVTTAITTGTTMVLGGFASGATVNEGDLITLTGVYAMDQVGQKPLSQQKQVVVTTGGTASVGGALTIEVFPAFTNTGSRINFFTPGTSPNQVPAATVVNFVTNSTSGYINNLAFTDRGIALVMPPLPRMDSPFSAVATDPTSGVSMRISRSADVLNNVNTLRLDAQMGVRWINDQSVKLVSALGL